jgi:hypothetical protein
MSPTFWSNTIWYVILGAVTVTEMIIILLKAGNRRRVFAFFLTVSGLTFSLEMGVYSYLKGYQYFPMIIPQSPPDDSIAGNIFSQLFISATAVFIAVFNLKFLWFVIFAFAIGAIEEFFMKISIFKQNWYQTWMTILGLLPIFWAVKKLYLKTIGHIGHWRRYVFVYLGLVTVYQHTINWPLRLMKLRLLSENFLSDKERSLVVLSAANMLLTAAAIMVVYYSHIKKIWKAAIVIGLYVVCLAAEKAGLIMYKEGWFFWASTISTGGMYLYTYLLDRLYGHGIQRDTLVYPYSNSPSAGV